MCAFVYGLFPLHVLTLSLGRIACEITHKKETLGPSTGRNQLHLDKTLEHGQVRKVNPDWVDDLEKQFAADRPQMLELTVWKELGVQPCILFPIPLHAIVLFAL